MNALLSRNIFTFLCNFSCIQGTYPHPCKEKKMVVCKFIQVDDICNTETCLDKNNKKAHKGYFFWYEVSKFGGKNRGL